MGQIKNDFVNYMLSHHTSECRHMNVQEIGNFVEDFLVWKADRIKRNTEHDNLNSCHGYPSTFNKDEFKHVRSLIDKLSKD